MQQHCSALLTRENVIQDPPRDAVLMLLRALLLLVISLDSISESGIGDAFPTRREPRH